MFSNYYALEYQLYENEEMQAVQLPKAKAVAIDIFKHLSYTPKNILALNNSWMSKSLSSIGLDVTNQNAIKDNQRFDTVLAINEALTWANNEIDQKKIINEAINRVNPGGYLIASVRDYKNTNCHKKQIGDTTVTYLNGTKIVTTEVNQLDEKNKQSWNQDMYVIVDDHSFVNLQLGRRHTLYFKQLAKYCSDAKCSSFGVIKDMQWRSPFRKQVEYIVWAKF